MQDHSDDALLREVGARLHARISTEAQAVIEAAVQQMEGVDSREREELMEQHVAEALSKWLISRKFADPSHAPRPTGEDMELPKPLSQPTAHAETDATLAQAAPAHLDAQLALVEGRSALASLDLSEPPLDLSETPATTQEIDSTHEHEAAQHSVISNGSLQAAGAHSGMLAARKLRESGVPCPKSTDAAGGGAPADEVFGDEADFAAATSGATAAVAYAAPEDADTHGRRAQL